MLGFGSGLISGAFNSVLTILLLALLILKVAAFIDALTYPKQAYESAGKLTKVAWLLFLGIAAVADVFFGSLLSILTIIGTVAMIVYFVDVRPALRQITGRGTGRGTGRRPNSRWTVRR
jgi:hypothetical protein